jgi:hypothetical protein
MEVVQPALSTVLKTGASWSMRTEMISSTLSTLPASRERARRAKPQSLMADVTISGIVSESTRGDTDSAVMLEAVPE